MKTVPSFAKAPAGKPMIGRCLAAALLCAAAWPANAAPAIAYESLNAGGISYATSGVVKLGGTLGQSGLTGIGTGGTAKVQSGFWKLENGCELHPTAVSSFLTATGQVAITFRVMWSNVYTVSAIMGETGGPMAGTHAWTNLVATLTGAGGMGSTTTIYVNAAALTNRAQFYRVVCADP